MNFVDVTLTDEEYEKLSLLSNNYPIVFRHVDVRLDKVVYAARPLGYEEFLGDGRLCTKIAQPAKQAKE